MFYIDDDYKCHAENDGSMRGMTAAFFDGKCAEFIEGYRYVPPGECWTREDGKVFAGEMISSWKDYAELEREQRRHEREAAEDFTVLLEKIPNGIMKQIARDEERAAILKKYGIDMEG